MHINFHLIFTTTLLILATCKDPSPSSFPKDSRILELTDKNFKEKIDVLTKGFFFLFVYSETCPYSKQTALELTILYDKLSQSNSKVILTQLEGVKNKEVSNMLEIGSFPTLLLYFHDSFIEYIGDRTADAMFNYLTKAEGELYETVTSSEEIRTISEKYNKTIICTSSKDQIDEIIIFSKMALIYEDIKYLLCNSEECQNEFDGKKIIFLKNYDEQIVFFENDTITFPNLKDFIVKYSVQMASLLNEQTVKYMVENDKTTLFYFRDSNNLEQVSKEKFIKIVANEYRDIYFTYLDVEGNDLFVETSRFLDIDKSDLPVIEIVEFQVSGQKLIYKMPKEDAEKFNEYELSKFVKAYLNGEIERLPISESKYDAPKFDNFSYIIGKDFQEMVMDSDINWIILFIEDACLLDEECVSGYRDMWEKLSSKYNEKNIKFAFFNLDQNEILGLDYPEKPQVVYAFMKGLKTNPFAYGGKEDEKSISQWIDEVAKDPVKYKNMIEEEMKKKKEKEKKEEKKNEDKEKKDEANAKTDL